MTIQELIDELEKFPNKQLKVKLENGMLNKIELKDVKTMDSYEKMVVLSDSKNPNDWAEHIKNGTFTKDFFGGMGL